MTEPASNPSIEVLSSTVEHSASIGKIAASIAKAQATIVTAEKGEMNPHFGKAYADLADVWSACRDSLTANGLGVVQLPSAEGAKVTMVTYLVHDSGEWFRGALTVSSQKTDPQGIGSTITYLRRYALAAIAGVAPKDDDDGNAGSAGRGNDGPPPQQRAASKPAQAPQQQASASATDMPEAVKPFAKRFESIEKGDNAKAEFDKVVASSRETFEKGSLEYKAWAKCAVAAQNRLGIAPAKPAQAAQ